MSLATIWCIVTTGFRSGALSENLVRGSPSDWLQSCFFSLKPYPNLVLAGRPGCMIVGTITATGGGTVRDVLLGNTPVFWMHETEYLWMCLATSVAVFFLWSYLAERGKAGALLRKTRNQTWNLCFSLSGKGLDAFRTAHVELDRGCCPAVDFAKRGAGWMVSMESVVILARKVREFLLKEE